MDEGSGSHDLAKKPPMLSPSSDEVGGALLRSDRGLDVAVAVAVVGGASSGGPPSSGTEMGQVVFVATAVD